VSSYSPGIDVTASDVLFEGFEIYGNGSLTGGPYPTFRASTGSDGLIISGNVFRVFTGEIGQMGLFVADGVKDVQFNSNNLINYEHSVFHAAWISGTLSYYGSIQDAVDRANVGQTVYVADGTYAGGQITVNKSIRIASITGDHATSDAIIDLGSVATYAIEFEQDCDAATVEGLEIINSYGIYVDLTAGGEGNVTINDNYIHDLFVGVAITGGFVVDAACWPPLENWTIQDNVFENITGSSSSGLRPENMKNVVISGNTINNMGYSGILLINVDGGVVTNNAVSNVDRAGIQIDSYCTRAIDVSYNIITQANTGSHSGYGGIRFYGQFTPDPHGDPPAEITANRNTCNDSYNGLAVRDGENISGRNITAMYNSLTNNSNMGAYHGGIGLLEVISCWWGDISGPYHPTSNPDGTGESVSDNIIFYPWFEFDGYSIPPNVEYEVGYPQYAFGSVVSDTTEFTITADDNESGMDTLTYRIWNTTHRWGEWINYTDDFTLSGDGMHMVQYNATDNAGTNNTDTNVHRVDTESPLIELLYPNGGEFISGYLTILWDAHDNILDQEQTRWSNSWPLSEDYPGHIQSFTPTENKLRSVQLLLVGDDANVSVKIFSNITPVPIPIGQSSQRLQSIGNPGYPVWIDFPLGSEIQLDTDKTYYIGVTQQILGNTGFDWYYLNSSGGVDPYEYGQAWLKKTDELELHPDWDWGFKTMYWDNDPDVTIEYSMTGVAPWSTIAEDEINDGSYTWDTTSYPDGESYRVRVLAEDLLSNMGGDASDGTFTIDNTGPSVRDVVITDTTVENTNFTKDGDNIEITATITGNPVSMEADLSGFGGGSSVPATSYAGTTAKWVINSVLCSPSDGPITVSISAIDATGDSGFSSGSITSDNTDPSVSVTRPGAGFYFMDSMRLLPFSYPFIIGQITISADATDDGSGIEEVEFYLENKLEVKLTEVPYNWLWDEAATGFFKLKVIAYDNVGHTAIDEVTDIFIINLDIFGH
jgi:hypothetical protein